MLLWPASLVSPGSYLIPKRNGRQRTDRQQTLMLSPATGMPEDKEEESPLLLLFLSPSILTYACHVSHSEIGTVHCGAEAWEKTMMGSFQPPLRTQVFVQSQKDNLILSTAPAEKKKLHFHHMRRPPPLPTPFLPFFRSNRIGFLSVPMSPNIRDCRLDDCCFPTSSAVMQYPR